MGGFFRWVVIIILLTCWGISTEEVTAKEQPAGNGFHARFIQGDGFTWEGEWKLHSDLTDLSANRMYISRGSGGYKIEFLPPVAQSNADWHPPLVRRERASVGESGIQYIAENSHQGVVFSRVTIHFERTENPDQLRGSLAFVSEHQFSGNDESWAVVDNYISTGVTALCAVRNNAALPSPCMATGVGFVPAEPTSQPQAAPTEQAAPVPEIQIPQAEVPQNQDAGPLPQVGVPPSTDTSTDWNMVSPVGQAAAAAATTALLALWLVLESQSAVQGSSSNDLVETILEETNFYSPAEAGSYLAANTSAMLDQLNKPPGAATTPQPSAPANTAQAAPATAAGGKPFSAYEGPVAGVETEVFGDRDAYLIMQALQLVPTEWLSDDHLMEVDSRNLDPLLGGHNDGKPHLVVLSNGREVFVNWVRGIAFEDRQHDDATDLSTIDFTNGFSVAVDVVIPGSGTPTPGTPADAGAQAGHGGAVQTQTSGNESGGGREGGTHAPGGESEGSIEIPVSEAETSVEAEAYTDRYPDEHVEQGDSRPTRTAEEDEAELDRFFGDTEEGDSQDQGSGRSTPAGEGSRGQGGGTYGGGSQGSGIDGSSSGGGSRLNSQVDTVSGDVEVEEADEGDLIGDEYAEDVEEEVIPESEWGDHATGQGHEELNARIDALMDEIKAGMQD
jgi:hypothetical protein